MTDQRHDSCPNCGADLHDHTGDVYSYATHPMSITEIKSERSTKAEDWTARDALICALRLIDSGELKVTAAAIILEHEDKRGTSHYRYIQSVSNTVSLLGMYAMAAYDTNRGNEE